MSDPDDLPIFRPKFGGPDRAKSSDKPLGFRNSVLASLRGNACGARKGCVPGRSRIAIARAIPRSRRVIVKVHVAPLRAGGAKAAALHVRYIERDGVEKDGAPGRLYGPEGLVDSPDFEAPRLGERHQFRLILSPEDAGELDLTEYVKRFMARVEKDSGQRLEWGAVNHYDTDHPHAHIIVRGIDRDGGEVRFDRAYVARGLRERAQELATEELGPRPEHDIARQRQKEISEDRFTTLDRDLERRAIDDRVDLSLNSGRKKTDASLLIARLEHLEELRLAERVSRSSWMLVPGWKEHLRELSTRGDIIKEMHRALQADPARYRIVNGADSLGEDASGAPASLRGRVVKKGLADELHGSFYAVVETANGGGYHVVLDRRAADNVHEGDLVSVTAKPDKWRRPEDSAIDKIAKGNAGVYDREALRRLAEVHGNGIQKILYIDLHNASGYRPGRSQGVMTVDMIANTHAKRLAELERIGLAARASDGKWALQEGWVEKLEMKDREEARRRVVVQREAMGLAEQVKHLGPVWLDGVSAEGLAPYGFGSEVRNAIALRHEELRRHGIDSADPRRLSALRELERRELARSIAKEAGAELCDKMPSGFQGKVRLHGRGEGRGPSYAEISDGRRFVLVPASRALRDADGQAVTLSRGAEGRMRVRAGERERGGR